MSKSSKSKRGGDHPGAGRKQGFSVYGESTKAIRVPESMVAEVKEMLNHGKQLFEISTAVLLPSSSPIPVDIDVSTLLRS